MAIGTDRMQVVFETRAELAGANAMAEELERQIGKAKALGKEYSQLDEQLKHVRAAIAGAAKPDGPGMGEALTKMREGLGDVIPGFAKLDGLLSKFAGGTLGAIAGGFAVVAGALETAKESLNEFAAAEEHVAKLDAALAQTGQLTDSYREKLQALALELQDATKIAGEQWLGVLTRLTQFGAKPENIEEYAEAVKNLAGILGGDVGTAAALVSRALQGNFELFSRYGIHVAEAGSQTQKLTKLFEELAARGGGQLEAAGRSLNGQWRDLKIATAELSKGFGRLIADTGLVQWGLTLVTDGFKYWGEAIAGVIPKVDGLENAARPAAQSLIEAAVSSKAFKDGLDDVQKSAEASAKALGTYVGFLKETQRLQDELADANMAAELAAVEDSSEPGGVKAQRKGDIRQKYAKAKFDRDQATTKKIIDAQDRNYFNAAGEVLGLDQTIADTKEQLNYQQTIESTQYALRQSTHRTGEAKKKWEETLFFGEQQKAKFNSDPKKRLNLPGLNTPEEYDEETANARKEYDDSIAAEQKARETLRALKGAPGVGDKSAAELAAQVAQLEELRKKKGASLEQAEEARRENPALREQLKYNEQIYNSRSSELRHTTGAEVQREQGREQKERDDTERRRLDEEIKIHGLGFRIPDTRPVESLLNKNHGTTLEAFGGIITTLEAQSLNLQKVKQAVSDVRDMVTNSRS